MSIHVGTHRRGPWRAHEVVAGAGAHEGHVGRIWDGGGTLRRGRACQRAKAEGGIDEKGARGCGDGERGDSEAEVGRGGSFFGAVSPTRAPQAMSYATAAAAAIFRPRWSTCSNKQDVLRWLLGGITLTLVSGVGC